MDARSTTLTVVGVRFPTASVAVRQALSLTPAVTAAVAERVALLRPGVEAVVVATCVRTELVVSGLGVAEALQVWHAALGPATEAVCLGPGADPYVYEGTAAVRHLFEVACGLDSPLLGEYEVLNQLRDAHQRAAELNQLGPVLRRVFRDAFAVGKRARATTAIASGGAGIGLAVAEVVDERRPDGQVLVLGAGHGARSIVRRLARRSRRQITVANRTIDTAASLASSVGGRGVGLEHLDVELADHDVVVSAVEAGTTLLTVARLERLGAFHPRWAPLIIDVGATPTVEPWSGAEHITLAELSARRDRLASVRSASVAAVQALIDDAITRRELARVEVLT